MEKLGVSSYKGFRTEFFITPSVKRFLEKHKVSIKNLEFKEDSDSDKFSHFYDTILFPIIDQDEDGKPDTRFGKYFKIIYFGIAEKGETFEDPLTEVNPRKIIIEEGYDKPDKVHHFAIKYKILKE